MACVLFILFGSLFFALLFLNNDANSTISEEGAKVENKASGGISGEGDFDVDSDVGGRGAIGTPRSRLD